MTATLSQWRKSPEGWALLAFFAFTCFALVGYGTFGLHPELLTRFPGAVEAYDKAYRLFSRGQIWVAFVVLLVPLLRHAGARWLPSFAALAALSLGSELLGTNYGVPFGGYAYTDLLGYKILGDVPVLIPISWFFMALPAWAIAGLGFGAQQRPWVRAGLGALLLTTWDLALDPAMSYLTPFWVWEHTGVYYGMPWINLLGWFVTGLVLMGALAVANADTWLRRLDPRWLTAYYAVNVLMPFGMCLLAGLWWAALATGVTLALTAVVLRGAAPASEVKRQEADLSPSPLV